jgi:hypothetical protein
MVAIALHAQTVMVEGKLLQRDGVVVGLPGGNGNGKLVLDSQRDALVGYAGYAGYADMGGTGGTGGALVAGCFFSVVFVEFEEGAAGI